MVNSTMFNSPDFMALRYIHLRTAVHIAVIIARFAGDDEDHIMPSGKYSAFIWKLSQDSYIKIPHKYCFKGKSTPPDGPITL